MNAKQQLKDIYQPFCYLIGWSKQKMFYYGVRYANKTTPKDLWTKYFTSSKYVADYRKNNGEPDIIQIRRIFNRAEDAIHWEDKVLRRLKVIYKDNWLNKNYNSAGTRHIVNKPKSEAQKEKQRQQITGKKHTQATKDKISKGLKAYTRTEEHQKNLSLSLKGIKKPSLLTGEFSSCIICGKNIYIIQSMIKKGYIKKTCSKPCKAALTRLQYIRRFRKI
jgi:hypothetical protein